MPAPLLIVRRVAAVRGDGRVREVRLGQYSAGEIVFYRSVLGLLLMGPALRCGGISWRTPVPGMHLGRCVGGTTALCLWFYAIGGLPLATAMTLNYMSSVWIALFLLGGAVLLGPRAAGRRPPGAGRAGRLCRRGAGCCGPPSNKTSSGTA
jgi:drug/metabolite transporter (DMT)-like permease